MRYLALIWGDEDARERLSEVDQQEVYARYREFAQAAGAKLVDGAATASTRSATTVRVRDGETHVSDGPFAETREQLGGFFVLECESMEEALELAKRVPISSSGAIEVRPAYQEEAA